MFKSFKCLDHLTPLSPINSLHPFHSYRNIKLCREDFQISIFHPFLGGRHPACAHTHTHTHTHTHAYTHTLYIPNISWFLPPTSSFCKLLFWKYYQIQMTGYNSISHVIVLKNVFLIQKTCYNSISVPLCFQISTGSTEIALWIRISALPSSFSFSECQWQTFYK